MFKTLFLPGASGSASFWKPVATAAGLDGVFLSWPGLGAEPPRQDISGIDDLIALTAREITEPVNIVAQSMGGLIAIQLALSMPRMVKRLVLGGVDKFEPVSGGGEMDHAEEAAGQLVVAGGDSSVDLEMAEYALDAVALLVERSVMLDLHPSV